jgi:hypothetical protein
MQTHRRATRRRSGIFIPVWVGAAALLATGGLAQEAGPSSAPASISEPEANRASAGVTDSAPYWLRVAGDQVNLRSRADLNSLPVARLDRDQVVQAVGTEYGWHRVLPPEGVFSLVAARYVDQINENEGVVSVSTGDLRVRVGSQLVEVDPLRSEVQRLLPRGTKVRIIGRQDEWLKIAPPEGVCFYISDEYVERITPELAAELGANHAPRAGTSVAASRPAEGPDLAGPWGQRLLLAEAAIEAESRKEALQQSWTGPLTELRPIAEQRADPAVARLAQRWISRLEERIADQAALRAVRQLAGETQRNEAQLEREMEQIRRTRERAASQPGIVARGQLRESFALRAGQSPPYRLVDPITRGVVAYLEFPLVSDVKPTEYLGLYVGVSGEKRADESFGADIIKVDRIEVLLSLPPASGPARTNP